MSGIICTCGHSLEMHGVQSGCAQCGRNCKLSQGGVTIVAQAARIAELEAALDELEQAAYEAIDHVGIANYTERQNEAKAYIRKVVAKTKKAVQS